MRDIILDWNRWTAAERIAAVVIPAALIGFVASFAPALAGRPDAIDRSRRP